MLLLSIFRIHILNFSLEALFHRASCRLLHSYTPGEKYSGMVTVGMKFTKVIWCGVVEFDDVEIMGVEKIFTSSLDVPYVYLIKVSYYNIEYSSRMTDTFEMSAADYFI